MDHLGHVALWNWPARQAAYAILLPTSYINYSVLGEELSRAKSHMLVTQHRFVVGTIPTSGLANLEWVKRIIGDYCQVCPVCSDNSPCWHWRARAALFPAKAYGGLTAPPMGIPTKAEEERLMQQYQSRDALSQLMTAAPTVADRFREQTARVGSPTRRMGRVVQSLGVPADVQEAQEAEARAIRDVSLTPQPAVARAPTPAGTIRCTACHQVIPPGFDKAKDTKKTVDEIYADCQHDFDETTKVCKKCNLPQRNNNRFSWLEVD